MTKLHQLGLIAALAAVSASSFAVDCNSLISKGLQNNIVASAQGVSLSDINVCLPQCDAIQSTGDPAKDMAAETQCSTSLNTLAYAVNYNNSISGLSPNVYASDPGGLPSLGSNAAMPDFSTSSDTTTPSVNNTYQKPKAQSDTIPTDGYIMSPDTTKSKKTTDQGSSGIRWF